MPRETRTSWDFTPRSATPDKRTHRRPLRRIAIDLGVVVALVVGVAAVAIPGPITDAWRKLDGQPTASEKRVMDALRQRQLRREAEAEWVRQKEAENREAAQRIVEQWRERARLAAESREAALRRPPVIATVVPGFITDMDLEQHAARYSNWWARQNELDQLFVEIETPAYERTHGLVFRTTAYNRAGAQRYARFQMDQFGNVRQL